MQYHGLFQAICRGTNRFDEAEDKTFGYNRGLHRNLFKKVAGAMAVYNLQLDDSDGGASPEKCCCRKDYVPLKKGRNERDQAFGKHLSLFVRASANPPRARAGEYIPLFSAVTTEIPDDLKGKPQPHRVSL